MATTHKCHLLFFILGLLYRNFASGRSVLQLYFSLIRPKLEYASAVWDPSTHKNINNIECVQKACLENSRCVNYQNLDMMKIPKLYLIIHLSQQLLDIRIY